MNINKKYLKLINSLLIPIALIGFVMLYTEILFPLAFILTAVSCLGIIFIQRHLNFPWFDQTEMDCWEKTRVQGRKKYLLSSLTFGLIMGAIALGYELIKNLYHSKPAFAGFGIGFITALIIYIFAPLLFAYEFWSFNEQRFKESETIENH